MADELTIPETPLETLETPLTINEIATTQSVVATEPQTQEEAVEQPAPKRKPGRPAGAKSKVQGKPRAPRKVRISEPEAHHEPEEAPSEAPLPQSRPIPTVSHDSTSAMMLSLLQEHAKSRQTRKADLWKSWFR